MVNEINEVCYKTSCEIWMPKYVVSLSVVMQTLCVFAIICGKVIETSDIVKKHRGPALMGFLMFNMAKRK